MKKVLFILVMSIFFIQCDDSDDKFIPPLTESARSSGTVVVDENGTVLVSDGSIAVGETVFVAEQDTSESGDSGNNQGSGDGPQNTPPDQGAGSGGTGSGDSGQDDNQANQSPDTGDQGNQGDQGGQGDQGSSGESEQIPDVDPVDDLAKNNSQFSKYKVYDSAGIYWIRELYEGDRAVFGWEFPPSFTIKVQSIEPRAKVLVTMYGVYPGRDNEVFYQYTVNQHPMKELEVDETKWVIVGGANYKYAYIEFQVIDEKGADITATTKAKINVHINDSALTAYLLKIKHRSTPLIAAALFVLLGIVVGINILRRKTA